MACSVTIEVKQRWREQALLKLPRSGASFLSRAEPETHLSRAAGVPQRPVYGYRVIDETEKDGVAFAMMCSVTAMVECLETRIQCSSRGRPKTISSPIQRSRGGRTPMPFQTLRRETQQSTLSAALSHARPVAPSSNTLRLESFLGLIRDLVMLPLLLLLNFSSLTLPRFVFASVAFLVIV